MKDGTEKRLVTAPWCETGKSEICIQNFRSPAALYRVAQKLMDLLSGFAFIFSEFHLAYLLSFLLFSMLVFI